MPPSKEKAAAKQVKQSPWSLIIPTVQEDNFNEVRLDSLDTDREHWPTRNTISLISKEGSLHL